MHCGNLQHPFIIPLVAYQIGIKSPGVFVKIVTTLSGPFQ